MRTVLGRAPVATADAGMPSSLSASRSTSNSRQRPTTAGAPYLTASATGTNISDLNREKASVADQQTSAVWPFVTALAAWPAGLLKRSGYAVPPGSRRRSAGRGAWQG